MELLVSWAPMLIFIGVWLLDVRQGAWSQHRERYTRVAPYCFVGPVMRNRASSNASAA